MPRPFCFSFIGNFSYGRPTMEWSWTIFSKLGLRVDCSLGHLDPKCMLIRLQEEEDFNRIRLQEVWFLDGFHIRTFRWSPDFMLEIKSSIVPVWVSLPNLPLFLFNKNGLLSIGSLLGKSLTLDAATADLSRPSVARLCEEVDLLKRLPQKVCLDCESMDGFWQDVIYEKLPH